MSEIKSGVISMGIHGGGLAIRLSFMLVLLRYSTPTVMGLYSVAVAMEAISIYASGLEFHTFTARRYARSATDRRLKILISVHRRLLAFTVPLSACFAVLVGILLDFSHDFWTLIPLALVISSGTVMQELCRYLNLNRQPIQSIFINFLRSAAWQPVTFFFLADSHNLIRYILWLWALFSLSGVFLGAWVLRGFLKSGAIPRLRYILKGLANARTYYAIATAAVLQGNLERLILQVFLGPSSVGVFSFFQTLANTLGSISQAAIMNVALPSILTRFNRRTDDRFIYLKNVMKRILISCLAISILICLFAVPLIHVVSKAEYTSKLWILPVLLLSQSQLVWSQPIHVAMYASHKDRLLILITFSALVASLFFDMFFITTFGIVGAVLAPFIVGLSIVVARRYWMNRLHNSGEL